MFDLSLGEEKIMFEETGYMGKIIIGEFEEYFFSNDSFFKKEDYYKNWLKSVDDLFDFSKTFFLTNVYDPKYANFYMAWSCHIMDNIVYFQDCIIPCENYCLEEVIYSNVEMGDIEFVDDEGNKISTWKTDVNSINDFKDRLMQRLS